MDSIEGLQGTLAYIDAHLTEELSVGHLAAQAGYSAFHFCRLFQWGVGYSVMEYVRGRRLAFAAYALQSDRRILDIALEYGYETHSGFSKAFRRHFGCPPEVYRLHAHCGRPRMPDLACMKNYRIGGIVMEPKFVTLPAVKLAGYALKTTTAGHQNMQSIPAFWTAYMTDGRMEKLHGEAFLRRHAEYGACFPENPETGEFNYIIGVEVKERADVPGSYHVCELPPETYAVFSTPPCGGEGFVPAIQGTWGYIYNEWFPGSGYEYAPGGVDFELYDERCMGEDGKVCEIWIPIVKKRR